MAAIPLFLFAGSMKGYRLRRQAALPKVVQRRRMLGVNLMWLGAHKSSETVYTRFDEQHNSSCNGKYFIFASISSASHPLFVYPNPLSPRCLPRVPCTVYVFSFHIVIAIACVCARAQTCGCHLDYSRANARAATHSPMLFIPSYYIFFLSFGRFCFFHFVWSFVDGFWLRLVRLLLPAVLT